MADRSKLGALRADLAALWPTGQNSRDSSGVHRGDIYLAHPEPDDPDLEREYVVVVRVVTSDEYVMVLQISDLHELATDHDLVLMPEESGLPFRCVVQANHRAALWIWQLDEYRGTVTDEVLELLPKVAEGAAGDKYGFRIGPPLQSEQDPRLQHKKERLVELRRLATSCTNAILDDRSIWAGERTDNTATELVEDILKNGESLLFTRPHVFNSGRVLTSGDDQRSGGILDPGIFTTRSDDTSEIDEALKIVALVRDNPEVKIYRQSTRYIEAVVSGIKANFPRHGHLIMNAFSYTANIQSHDRPIIDIANRILTEHEEVASTSTDTVPVRPQYVATVGK